MIIYMFNLTLRGINKSQLHCVNECWTIYEYKMLVHTNEYWFYANINILQHNSMVNKIDRYYRWAQRCGSIFTLKSDTNFDELIL